MDSAEDFYEWTFEIRGNDCKCVSNKPVGSNNENVSAKATFWSKEPMDFPRDVSLVESGLATGEAPAVDEEEVSGWNKYEVVFTPIHN